MKTAVPNRVEPPTQGALTLEEAGSWLRLGRDAIRDLIRMGKLRPAHVGPGGGRMVIAVEECQRYLRECTEASSTIARE